MTAPGVLHQRVSPDTLGVVRAAVFAIWLAEVVPDPLAFLAELPAEMHEPVGIFKAVPEDTWNRLLTPTALEELKTVLVVLLVLSTLGVRPYQPIAAATAALLTVHQELVRGFTFANHEELALLICTYVLALFPAADGFAWPKPRRPSSPPATYSAALLAMSLLLLLPYSGIGAHRLVNAAPDVFLGDTLPNWLASLDALERDRPGIGLWILGRPGLLPAFKAAFLVTTMFELLAPLCVIMPRFRRAWITVMVPFHVLSRFTLNLFFWHNLVLLLLLLTNTETWVSRAQGLMIRGFSAATRSRRRRARRSLAGAPQP